MITLKGFKRFLRIFFKLTLLPFSLITLTALVTIGLVAMFATWVSDEDEVTTDFALQEAGSLFRWHFQ